MCNLSIKKNCIKKQLQLSKHKQSTDATYSLRSITSDHIAKNNPYVASVAFITSIQLKNWCAPLRPTHSSPYTNCVHVSVPIGALRHCSGIVWSFSEAPHISSRPWAVSSFRFLFCSHFHFLLFVIFITFLLSSSIFIWERRRRGCPCNVYD